MKTLCANLIVVMIALSGQLAWAKVSVNDPALDSSIDFLSLNELDQEAHKISKSLDPRAVKEFNSRVDAFLESGIPDAPTFISLMDRIDIKRQMNPNYQPLSGDIHPLLVKAFFTALVPEIINQRDALKKAFFKEKALSDYKSKMLLAGTQIEIQHIINSTPNYHVPSQPKIEKIQRFGSKVLVVRGIITALNLRSCTATPAPLDFMSGVWFVDSYSFELLPNRWHWNMIAADTCSHEAFEKLGGDYAEGMESHARKTF